ncbi:MAG TPA: lipoate--protein ligase family protein, partial [Pirellulaceae bacterium]|nr:lipoate--protein ligase family protein [Pirellulaceae bacterium]
MRSARLMLDPPAPGAWNMAVDEVLLDSAATAGIATLRFYQWSEPTLSLGYFQAAAGREQHPASRACPLVRRASGGGAIVHHRELTYSIALPLRDSRSQAATDLYNACHESLVAALAELGVTAEMYQPAESCAVSAESHANRPFLCFERRACGDIVCGTSKIVGSAQRRRRGAVLQHGSILLGRSACAPELPGIEQFTRQSITAGQIIHDWPNRLAARLQLAIAPARLTSDEHQNAATIADSR